MLGEPGRLVGHAQQLHELVRGQPVLGLDHQRDRQEPLPRRQVRVVEERSGRDAEVVAARAAVELLARLEACSVARLAPRAAHAVGPPKLLEVRAATILRPLEVAEPVGFAPRKCAVERTPSDCRWPRWESSCRIATHHNGLPFAIRTRNLERVDSAVKSVMRADLRGRKTRGPLSEPPLHTTGVSLAAGSAHFPAALSDAPHAGGRHRRLADAHARRVEERVRDRRRNRRQRRLARAGRARARTLRVRDVRAR